MRAQDIVDWNTNRAFYDKVLAEARSDGSYADAINYLFAEGRRDQETLGKLLLAGGLEGLRGIENQPLWSMAGWSWNGQYSALKQQLTAESRRREAEGNAQAAENLRRFRAEAAAGRANTGPVTPKIKIERCYQMPSSMGFPGGRYCSKD